MGSDKMVYFFGGSEADGDGSMKNTLGGKGANLAEMCSLGIPVPAGFTIPTDICTYYYDHGRQYPPALDDQIKGALKRVEAVMGREFGSTSNPLLLSVRSGARQSMPGMMETVLNIGLTSKTLPALIQQTGNERFAYDAYRRLITMYSDVVMEKAAGIEPEEDKGIRTQLEHILDAKKEQRGIKFDKDLTTEDLKDIVAQYKAKVKEVLGTEFPDDEWAQLKGGINAVFASWMGKRAQDYRRLEGIPAKWGTAVNVQAMVFGNMGEKSATGVAFSRNPSTGENAFYGEWLVDAQGEDVVAGIRTPNPLRSADITDEHRKLGIESLEEANPAVYAELDAIRVRLEKHYKDMQDVEFTIENGVLWMLQTRVGKRNGVSAVRMAVEMLKEGLIDEETAIMRVKPSQLNELLLPMIDPVEEKNHKPLTEGLPAGPGGAVGKLVFSPTRAEEQASGGDPIILARIETSPEDVAGMKAASGILTSRGGMTSHAALVARGWGKCCIVGASEMRINYAERTMTIGDKTFKEGDFVTLNGTKGTIYEGKLKTLEANPDANENYKTLMSLADKKRVLKVRTNSDTGEDASRARRLGAEGIGLCRTEHMFFEEDRIPAIRKLILTDTHEGRQEALAKLLPLQRKDFEELFEAMAGFQVTIRLLDPPLHEFLPPEDASEEAKKEVADQMGISVKELSKRIHALHENNPMLGHRGCRLGNSMPEITEMQARAIFEAAANITKKGKTIIPEVMVPLVGHVNELKNQKKHIQRMAKLVMAEMDVEFEYQIGTMIELPRACVTAGHIAEEAEFFSFGTNDLTQTTFGFSRDDIGSFLPNYLENKILENDPFASIDQEGVGQLVRMAAISARAKKHDFKLGICGEHGGDPDSVVFFHRVGLNYVSCSPFRVPIARLAAAQAALKHEHGGLTNPFAAGKDAAKNLGEKVRDIFSVLTGKH
ncbi:MAG: pyruvate, phosphate dikinase [Sumerlaeia bacterium]